MSLPSLPAVNLSQGLLQQVGSSHEVAKVLQYPTPHPIDASGASLMLQVGSDLFWKWRREQPESVLVP